MRSMRNRVLPLALLALLAPLALVAAHVPIGAAQTPGFDILIRGGRVLDGTGNPWYRADIGITGDRIRAMGSLGSATAKTVIDAADRYITPGFIDVHSHAGGGLATEELKHGQPLLAPRSSSIQTAAARSISPRSAPSTKSSASGPTWRSLSRTDRFAAK
jgi:imidazolonepropionase-like amidohydrolase